MDISVVICTWNRADLLRPTLEQLTRIKVPFDVTWELVLVNNNSTDSTDDVVTAFEGRLPLRRIFESKQGLSNARNAAVEQANGEYIIWTDDDVLVDEDWLAAYCAAFERWPNADVFGGKVLPWFEMDPPKWLSENIGTLGTFFALRDLGDDERVVPVGSNPYGASMAFRASVLRQYRFDPNLGRSGTLLVGGEETEVINKIRAGGSDVVWVPDAIVKHYLPAKRMTLAYLRDLHYCNGRYEKVVGFDVERTILGYSPWLIKRWLNCELRYLYRRLSGSASAVWLKEMMDASVARGQLVSARKK